MRISTHRSGLQRKRLPLCFALFGALGDLSLARIVGALFRYCQSSSDLPLLKVVLCDLESGDDLAALAAKVYANALEHRHLYFLPELLAARSSLSMILPFLCSRKLERRT